MVVGCGPSKERVRIPGPLFRAVVEFGDRVPGSLSDQVGDAVHGRFRYSRTFRDRPSKLTLDTIRLGFGRDA